MHQQRNRPQKGAAATGQTDWAVAHNHRARNIQRIDELVDGLREWATGRTGWRGRVQYRGRAHGGAQQFVRTVRTVQYQRSVIT